MATIAIGAMLLWKARAVSAAMGTAFGKIWNIDHGYDRFLDALVGTARAVTARLQTGTLRHYLLVTLVVVAVGLLSPMISSGFTRPSSPIAPTSRLG